MKRLLDQQASKCLRHASYFVAQTASQRKWLRHAKPHGYAVQWVLSFSRGQKSLMYRLLDQRWRRWRRSWRSHFTIRNLLPFNIINIAICKINNRLTLYKNIILKLIFLNPIYKSNCQHISQRSYISPQSLHDGVIHYIVVLRGEADCYAIGALEKKSRFKNESALLYIL